mgnify:CR=1 FL=1|tara:strand:+ start:274 stop:597 length:324 start_codon:yes stop_codon:yes gene_type:complete
MMFNLKPIEEYEELMAEAEKTFHIPVEYVRNSRCKKCSADAVRGCITNILLRICNDVYALSGVMHMNRTSLLYHVKEHASRMETWPEYRGSFNHLEKHLFGEKKPIL